MMLRIVVPNKEKVSGIRIGKLPKAVGNKLSVNANAYALMESAYEFLCAYNEQKEQIINDETGASFYLICDIKNLCSVVDEIFENDPISEDCDSWDLEYVETLLDDDLKWAAKLAVLGRSVSEPTCFHSLARLLLAMPKLSDLKPRGTKRAMVPMQ